MCGKLPSLKFLNGGRRLLTINPVCYTYVINIDEEANKPSCKLGFNVDSSLARYKILSLFDEVLEGPVGSTLPCVGDGHGPPLDTSTPGTVSGPGVV